MNAASDLGLVLQAGAWLLFATQGIASEMMVVVTGNLLFAAGVSLKTASLMEFQKRRAPAWLTLLLPVGIAGGFFLLLDHPRGQAMFNGLAYTAMYAGMTVLMVKPPHTTSQRIRWLMILSFGSICAGFLVRAILSLLSNTPLGHPLGPGPLETMSYLYGFVILLSSSAGLLLMHKERADELARQLAGIDPLTGVDKTISPIWSIENDRSDSQQLARTRYRYAIDAFNAKYFGNRLIFLGAVRVDSFFNLVRQQIAAGDYDAATWNGLTYLFKPDAPADWAGLTFTPKAANGAATGPTISADTRPRDGNGNPQPQYARDRFKDDYNAPAIDKRQVTRSFGLVYHLTRWVTPYANYAETFNPPGAIQRIDSSFLPPTVAKGTDLGLRFTLLGGRVTLSAARYTNEEQNNGFDPGVQGNINGILGANAVGDLTTSGRNIRGLGNVPAVMRDLRDRRATGYELEAVANLTRQWRLLVNLGLPKVYEERAFRDTKAYLAANDATLRQIMADSGALIDAGGTATVNNEIGRAHV